jgi:hypothetical protein
MERIEFNQLSSADICVICEIKKTRRIISFAASKTSTASWLFNNLELSTPVAGTTLLGFVRIDGIRVTITFINNPFRFYTG